LGDITGKTIYEVGSGNGHLINFLAGEGATCIGTEIALNRPSKKSKPGLSWHETDGVNLDDFEPVNSFDLIISDQVVEHLHPEDINLHFISAFKLLKKGGKYVFYTPSYYIGPGDVSRIFGCIVAEGMHLKEYKYYELYDILKSAGFKKLYVPNFRANRTKMHSEFTVQAFLLFEKSLRFIPDLVFAKKIYRRLMRFFNMPIEVVFAAEKC
jgi:SAM-dependent methyltransferase